MEQATEIGREMAALMASKEPHEILASQTEHQLRNLVLQIGNACLQTSLDGQKPQRPSAGSKAKQEKKGAIRVLA